MEKWIASIAWLAHPRPSMINMIRTNCQDQCTHGAINMLDLAMRTHARILQALASEVYGDREVHAQPESYWVIVNPIGNRIDQNQPQSTSDI